MTVEHSTRTTNHVPHSYTYADDTAFGAATGFAAGDVGKLAVVTARRRKLFRLKADTPTWEALTPLGETTLVVDAEGGGDYLTLSAALASIADAATDKHYTVLVTGPVAETAQIAGKSYVHVQGLGGAKITVTFAGGSNNDAVLLSSIVSSVWRDIEIVCAGTGARHGFNVAGCNSTVRLDNVKATGVAGKGVAITDASPIELKNVEADITSDAAGAQVGIRILDAGDVFVISRPYSIAMFEYLLCRQSTGTDATELLTPDGSQLVLPTLSSWAFTAVITACKTTGATQAASYHITGCIRRITTAASTALVGTPTQVVCEDDSGWGVTVSADTSTGALKFVPIGAAGDNVNWVAHIKVVQALVL